jgi:hypothetical protein
MALNFPDNRYPGVSAHLNSYMQQQNGTWSSFHAKFANTLQELLDSTLPSNYYAALEQGFQISEIGEEKLQKSGSEPDVSILQKSRSIRSPQSSSVATPTATIPLRETLEFDDEDDRYIRVSVYKSEPDDVRGKLVTAIEIISPSNKPTRQGYAIYVAKRVNLLIAGINLVEIDLLHEGHPINEKLPSYRTGENNSFPYNIGVSIPYPDMESGNLTWYGVDVDKPLPTIILPLAGEEKALLDINTAYNQVFERTRQFSILVDYEKLPVNFERYSATDQQRIKDILERIREDLS